MVNEKNYIKWINEGIEAGYISKPFCYTHDGDPYMTEEENAEWEDGGDPCSPVVKLVYETGYLEDVMESVKDELNSIECALPADPSVLTIVEVEEN
jgi:hypothetical protein